MAPAVQQARCFQLTREAAQVARVVVQHPGHRYRRAVKRDLPGELLVTPSAASVYRQVVQDFPESSSSARENALTQDGSRRGERGQHHRSGRRGRATGDDRSGHRHRGGRCSRTRSSGGGRLTGQRSTRQGEETFSGGHADPCKSLRPHPAGGEIC